MLLDLDQEVRIHPPYNQSLALSNYYLLLSLSNGPRLKIFSNEDDLNHDWRISWPLSPKPFIVMVFKVCPKKVENGELCR